MYHCHLQIYLISRQPDGFAAIRDMAPMEFFTHTFFESSEPQQALAARADLILVDLQGMDAACETKKLAAWKKPEADLVVLAGKEQVQVLEDCLSQISDLWTLPLSQGELRFRFLRWQQNCKTRKDYWEASQYLESTINSVPNLIWYKDKDGVHEKVNDSFCQAVSKTKTQVQGRRHAYIWDVEQDDPACIESERIVMETRETRISGECIQTQEGSRLLTTYKSPLYDLDGSVMGTVGVAIDVTKEQEYAQELLQRSQTLEAIFTSMDCGIMCHSLDGSRITRINGAALRILGYESQEELMAAGFDMMASSVLEEDRARLQESFKTLEKEGDSINVAYRIQHTAGDVLYIMGNIKLIREDGELVYQRLLLDCTAQKQREELKQQEKERHQIELIHALSIEYSLVCYFDLNTGAGNALRSGDCGADILQTIFSGDLVLEECMGRYIETCVYDDDKEAMREAATCGWLERELSHKNKKMCFINYRKIGRAHV